MREGRGAADSIDDFNEDDIRRFIDQWYIDPEMSSRMKKFVGLLVTLLWLAVYSILLVGIAIRVLPGAGSLVEFFFYMIGGLAWTIPLFPLIAWMNRPGRHERANQNPG